MKTNDIKKIDTSTKSVFDIFDMDGVIDVPVVEHYQVTRCSESERDWRISQSGVDEIDIDTLEVYSLDEGILLHGSERTLSELLSGEELYDKGIGVNCHNVGGWCNGISLTPSPVSAEKFGTYTHIVHVAATNAVFIPEAYDAICLYNVRDALLARGVGLVYIGNRREQEVVCLDKSLLNIEMVINTNKKDVMDVINALYDPYDMLAGYNIPKYEAFAFGDEPFWDPY